MMTGLVIFHVVVCILLTITVLVQFGKGAEAGAMMGGGSSQAVFTSSAKGNFFTKLTTFLAIAFMANSIILTTVTSQSAKDSLFDGEAPVAAPLNSDTKTDTPKTETPAAKVNEKTETDDTSATKTPAPKAKETNK